MIFIHTNINILEKNLRFLYNPQNRKKCFEIKKLLNLEILLKLVKSYYIGHKTLAGSLLCIKI